MRVFLSGAASTKCCTRSTSLPRLPRFYPAHPYKMHVISFAKGRRLIWIFPYNRTGAGLNGRKYRFIESLSVSVVFMAIFVELFRVFIEFSPRFVELSRFSLNPLIMQTRNTHIFSPRGHARRRHLVESRIGLFCCLTPPGALRSNCRGLLRKVRALP